MNELINEQIILIQKELEEIANPYERAHVRVLLLQALSNLAMEPVDMPEGKEAIKNEQLKPISFEEKVEEKKNTKKADKPKELDLDKGEETTRPIIFKSEEGEVDVTASYNLLTTFEGTEEEKVELAASIQLNSLAPIYEELSQLKDCNNKMMLAYYMSEFGLEEINNFVADLTDNTFNDIYEFINNENLDGFIINVENAIQEE